MKFQYNPTVIKLQHPFRYINGILIKNGFNDLDSNTYSALFNTPTFQELLAEKAIILMEEPKRKRKPVEVKEVQPIKEEVKPEEPPKQENSIFPDNFDISKKTVKEGLAIIAEETNIGILSQWLEQENSVGKRIKIIRAIELKLNSSDEEQ